MPGKIIIRRATDGKSIVIFDEQGNKLIMFLKESIKIPGFLKLMLESVRKRLVDNKWREPYCYS